MVASPKCNLICRIVKDVTTIGNGQDFCCVRIMGWLILFFGCGMIAYNTIALHNQFNIGSFFSSVAWIPPAVGGGIWMKKDDEPGTSNRQN